MNRRIVPVRLRSPQENPCERSGFRCEPDTLAGWSEKHRVELLRSCLVLCLNWIAEEMPAGRSVMGTYEAYARVMGGILDVAGISGFLGNLKAKATTSVDRESVRWPGLIGLWATTFASKPITVGELYDVIHQDEGSELQVAFADVMGDGSPLSRKQRLGNSLTKQVDRVWGNHRIVVTEIKGRGGVLTYKLISSDEPVTT